MIKIDLKLKKIFKAHYCDIMKTIQSTFDLENNTLKTSKNNLISIGELKYKKNEFNKCPFNYIGGKHKILPQLFTVFPKNNDIFIDVFGGGFNVGINSNASKIIYNDQLTPLVDLFKYFQDNSCKDIIAYIEKTIKDNNIRKDEKEGFIKFRKKYNQSKEKFPLDLYILISYSFNYQFRFNNSGEYNNPHGTNRSSFTKNMKERLIKYIKLIHDKNIIFLNKDFTQVDYSILTENSFVYCDPPYLITTGSYNDGNRGFKNWTLKEEKELLNLLSILDKNGIKFALSNVTIHDGKQNELLLDWININNFTALDINSDYSNSNYHKKNTEKEKNKEILVIDYPFK